MTTPPTVGERILQARRAAGLKQKDLAAQLGLTPTALNYYEKNKREPGIEVLKALSSALGVSVDYLMGIESPRGRGVRGALSAGRYREAEALLDLPQGSLAPAGEGMVLEGSAMPYYLAGGGGALLDEAAGLLFPAGGQPYETTRSLLGLLPGASEEDLEKLLGVARVLLGKP